MWRTNTSGDSLGALIGTENGAHGEGCRLARAIGQRWTLECEMFDEEWPGTLGLYLTYLHSELKERIRNTKKFVQGCLYMFKTLASWNLPRTSLSKWPGDKIFPWRPKCCLCWLEVALQHLQAGIGQREKNNGICLRVKIRP